MRAIVLHQYGGPEVLKFEDCPDPVPGPGEVLVRVAAASVNPIDYKRRAGLKDFYPMQFPGLIGVDMPHVRRRHYAGEPKELDRSAVPGLGRQPVVVDVWIPATITVPSNRRLT